MGGGGSLAVPCKVDTNSTFKATLEQEQHPLQRQENTLSFRLETPVAAQRPHGKQRSPELCGPRADRPPRSPPTAAEPPAPPRARQAREALLCRPLRPPHYRFAKPRPRIPSEPALQSPALTNEPPQSPRQSESRPRAGAAFVPRALGNCSSYCHPLALSSRLRRVHANYNSQ